VDAKYFGNPLVQLAQNNNKKTKRAITLGVIALSKRLVELAGVEMVSHFS
jgi:hypothetical protein